MHTLRSSLRRVMLAVLAATALAAVLAGPAAAAGLPADWVAKGIRRVHDLGRG